jgi:hypothetical protein
VSSGSLAQDRFKIGKEAIPFGSHYWSSADIGLSMSKATWRGPVKKAIAALALATLIVSPALAQSYEPEIGSGNIVHPYFAQPFPPGIYLGDRFAPARRGRNGSRIVSIHTTVASRTGDDPDCNPKMTE